MPSVDWHVQCKYTSAAAEDFRLRTHTRGGCNAYRPIGPHSRRGRPGSLRFGGPGAHGPEPGREPEWAAAVQRISDAAANDFDAGIDHLTCVVEFDSTPRATR